LRIQALVLMNRRAEAQRHAREFRRRFPQSALWGTIQASLAEGVPADLEAPKKINRTP
jgi:hypothetical protein